MNSRLSSSKHLIIIISIRVGLKMGALRRGATKLNMKSPATIYKAQVCGVEECAPPTAVSLIIEESPKKYRLEWTRPLPVFPAVKVLKEMHTNHWTSKLCSLHHRHCTTRLPMAKTSSLPSFNNTSLDKSFLQTSGQMWNSVPE